MPSERTEEIIRIIKYMDSKGKSVRSLELEIGEGESAQVFIAEHMKNEEIYDHVLNTLREAYMRNAETPEIQQFKQRNYGAK